MSSSSEPAAVPPVPRPTVFISYASEDRAAARQLRDALEAAGLDVWYDENELVGGDAWDQKLRRQIRDCEYFMPVISETTERRKEGYFRREWRLAAGRTLDMADDVMFLLPVTIDGTSEAGARVPEKFLTVQWLRVPGGAPTPALDALARRLATGIHPAPLRTEPGAGTTRAPFATSSPPPREEPPPMPAFPHLDKTHTLGDRFRFFAEVLWWLITAAWLLFKRAPRWVRLLLSLWVFFWLLTRCDSNDKRTTPHEPTVQLSPADKAEARQAIKATAETLARGLGSAIKDSTGSDKQIVAVPFALGVTDEADAKFLGAVFTPLYGRIAVERADQTGVVSQPLTAVTDEALVALGHQADATYVLGAWLTRTGGNATLTVRLVKTDDASVAWSGQFPVAGANPSALSDQIATGVLAAVPKN